MCYDPDPGVKAYYTLIDKQSGDLRPLYHIQLGGYFALTVNGKLGQSNKIVLDDKSWDRKVIYNVNFLYISQGLLRCLELRLRKVESS